ncbi:hypothetical protein ACPSKX_16285 [Moritella viscosa]
MRLVFKNNSDRTTKLEDKYILPILNNICFPKINTTLINDSIYRDAYTTEDGGRSRVEDKLALAYKNKCAYCERICKADIEHYRPKKKVTDDVKHPGYYWLCYEWTNLIPSCITCNRDGGKHNHFTIIGTRVNAPTKLLDGTLDLDSFKVDSKELAAEKPHLLHPEVDAPEDFFRFEVDAKKSGIRIIGIDADLRGKNTIKICKLNRQELTVDKVNVIDDVIDSLNCSYIKYSDTSKYTKDRLLDELEDVFDMLKNKSVNIEKTHTYLRKYIVLNSDNFMQLMTPFLGSLPMILIKLIADKKLNN